MMHQLVLYQKNLQEELLQIEDKKRALQDRELVVRAELLRIKEQISADFDSQNADQMSATPVDDILCIKCSKCGQSLPFDEEAIQRHGAGWYFVFYGCTVVFSFFVDS